MKYGARNAIAATVTSIEKGDVVALVKFEVTLPAKMASVLTTDRLLLAVNPAATEFGAAFACRVGQPMVREKPCRVW